MEGTTKDQILEFLKEQKPYLSVSKISSDLKSQFSNVEWDKIKSFRNIVAHNHFGVDSDEVWQIINSDIPQPQKFIEEIISDLDT